MPEAGDAFDAQITFLPCADLGATDRFYRERLGLRLAVDQGACRIYAVAGGAFVGFCTHLEPRVGDGVILTLVTNDVHGWHARLVAAGVEVDAPPQVNERFAIEHFFVRDPDGHRVEIQRFLDPGWAG